MPQDSYALPRGSVVLVTGANGYIGSHVVNSLLALGYRVRGTVRAPKPWLVEYFNDKYGPGMFETVIMPKLNDADALKDHIQGVSGVVHVVRTILSLTTLTEKEKSVCLSQ